MEDFVTFKIAKKLKKKGFREKCLTYYDVDDNVGLLYNTQYSDEMSPCQYTDLLMSHNTSEGRQPDDSDNCVDAPTISQVLKWLRDKKQIHICIDISEYGWFFDVTSFYKQDTGVYEIELPYKSSNITPDYESYEVATLAGIEYVLDNLI